jgi:hypothetical protein
MSNPEIIQPEGLIQPEYDLIGHDSNAGAIIGGVRLALKRAGNDREIVDSFTEQAMAGDYNHLLRVAMAFTDSEFPYDG